MANFACNAMGRGFLDIFLLHWLLWPAMSCLIFFTIVCFCGVGCCCKNSRAVATRKGIGLINFIFYLLYPSLCGRFIQLFKYQPVLIPEGEVKLLTADLSVVYNEGRHSTMLALWMIIGPAFMACASPPRLLRGSRTALRGPTLSTPPGFLLRTEQSSWCRLFR